MKIILDYKDIEKMIKKSFQGVSVVVIDKDAKAEIEVDINTFKKCSEETQSHIKTGKMVAPNTPQLTVVKELTMEKQNENARAKGLMASGGRERTISRIG